MRATRVAVARSTDRKTERGVVPTAAFVVGVIAMPVLVELSGIPDAQMRLEEAARAEAVRWDAAFCEKYGLAQGSERHKACLNDLLDLRRQERQRLNAQAQGLL
jgi:hypothetical protein